MSQEERKPKATIAWRRTPLERDQLLELTERSDFLGMLQAGGYLGLLAVTGTAACLLVGVGGHVVRGLVLAHGTLCLTPPPPQRVRISLLFLVFFHIWTLFWYPLWESP